MKEIPQNKNHNTYFVPGLQRGLRVLEILAESGESMTVNDITKRMEFGRSSVFRWVYTLKCLGFVDYSDVNKTYKLGARVLNLGFAYLGTQEIIKDARKHLEQLRDKTGIATHLAICDHSDVLYLDCLQANQGIQSTANIGKRVSAHASPLGWLLLSDLSSRELIQLFSDKDLISFTPQTPTTIAELSHKIIEVSSLGYVVSLGSLRVGGISIAAPIFDKDGKVVAAIDISGPDIAFDINKIESFYVPEVLNTANAISAHIS
ncbi:IclR family transcriptional regulator [Aliikangiella sp. IMCC44359]|uniref:IclR family transcriptional regulator n=1 Tax=Aliikangiella sp. IMCC44359 TaxID=3459125 RepID=UPI00403B1E48